MPLVKELRQALSHLGRNRTATVISLLTLMLCIGANTAIFSVIQAILLRPLPYPQPERLVTIYNSYPNVGVTRGSNSVPDYFDRRELTEVFANVALLDFGNANLGLGGAPERVRSVRVTPDLFPLLGVGAARGRVFAAEEAEVGNEKVVILGHGLWQRSFGGREGVIGQTLQVSGESYTVVGVMPAGFDLLDQDVELFTPFAATAEERSDQMRHSNFCVMLGRLAPGATIARAQEAIDALNATLIDRVPEYRPLIESSGFHTVVVDLHREIVSEVRDTLWLLQLGVGLVLLIGCVNVANLLMLGANGRLKELAIRAALGAGRWRIARQLLAESLILALAGGVLGLVLGALSLDALAQLGVDQLPRGATVQLDAGVALFTLALAAIAGLIFGLLPIVHVLRTDLNEVIRQESRAGSAGERVQLTRAALVIGQVALAFLLLIGAALMGVSFARASAVAPGFVSERVLSARCNLPAQRYAEDAQVTAFVDRALAEVSAIPGVSAAGVTSMLPFANENNASVVAIEGYEPGPGESPPVPSTNLVDAGYFRALGVPLRAGRLFDERDVADAPRAVIVDEEMAARYWPGQSPLGRRLFAGLEAVQEPGNERSAFTIVGVVGAIKTNDLVKEANEGAVYFSVHQQPARQLGLLVKTEAAGVGLTAAIRAAVQRVDPELPLYDVKTMETRIADSLLTRRTPMLLLFFFSTVALLLSAIGIYGVLAYAVSLRTREIGIRTALGARPGQVLQQILWQGLRLVFAGLALGIAGALAFSHWLTSLLYGIAPSDPRILAAAAVLLTVVATFACLMPSRRAARTDPIEALRYG